MALATLGSVHRGKGNGTSETERGQDRIRRARKERFDFLGYIFGPHHFRKDGQRYLYASLSRESIARLKQKVRVILNLSNAGDWPVVRDQVNAFLRTGRSTSATGPSCHGKHPYRGSFF